MAALSGRALGVHEPSDQAWCVDFSSRSHAILTRCWYSRSGGGRRAMDPKGKKAFCGLPAAEEARTREAVRRRLAVTRERTRQRHEQTLLRLAGLLYPNKPA